MLHRLWAGALVASLGVVASSAPSWAEPTWLPTVEVSSGAPVLNGHDVAHLPDGTTVVVWAEEVEHEERVFFATRGLGEGGFSTAERIDGGFGFDPQVVVDAQGGVSVAWVTGGTNLGVARLEPGAAEWSTPEVVASHSTSSFQLLAAPDGTLTVLTLHRVVGADPEEPAFFRVDAAVRPPGEDEEWTDPQVVAEETTKLIADLRAVVAADGTVTAVWTRDQGADSRVHVATPATVGGFVEGPIGEPRVGAKAPDLAQTPQGGVAVSWAQDVSTDAGLEVAVLSTRAPGSSSFSPAEAGGVAQQEVIDTEVVVDDAGTATVMSVAQTFDEYAVLAGTRRAGEPFSLRTVAVAGPGVRLGRLQVALAADGALTALWQRGADPDQTCAVYAAHRDPLADFATAVELTPVDDPGTTGDDVCHHDPAVAVDVAGDVALVWEATRPGVGPSTLRSRILDAAGPQLAVSVPSAAMPGSAVEMTASAVDTWSGPATLAWSFGDGATSVEATTSHGYDASGTYQVTVTATDAVGNTSTQTRSLLVGVPPTTLPTTPPTTPPTPPLDKVSPVLSNARVKPKLLPAARPAILRVTSSEAARLTGVVQRTSAGRWKAVGRKRWSVVAGANTEKLYGRTAQRLRSGTYRVRLTATDPAGNTSATVTIRFRVDRG